MHTLFEITLILCMLKLLAMQKRIVPSAFTTRDHMDRYNLKFVDPCDALDEGVNGIGRGLNGYA